MLILNCGSGLASPLLLLMEDRAAILFKLLIPRRADPRLP